jgi:hypothetical protein
MVMRLSGVLLGNKRVGEEASLRRGKHLRRVQDPDTRSSSGTMSIHEEANYRVDDSTGVVGGKEDNACFGLGDNIRALKAANEGVGVEVGVIECVSIAEVYRESEGEDKNGRGLSYTNAPHAQRRTSSNGKGMSSVWKGCNAMSRGRRRSRSRA